MIIILKEPADECRKGVEQVIKNRPVGHMIVTWVPCHDFVEYTMSYLLMHVQDFVIYQAELDPHGLQYTFWTLTDRWYIFPEVSAIAALYLRVYSNLSRLFFTCVYLIICTCNIVCAFLVLGWITLHLMLPAITCTIGEVWAHPASPTSTAKHSCHWENQVFTGGM